MKSLVGEKGTLLSAHLCIHMYVHTMYMSVKQNKTRVITFFKVLYNYLLYNYLHSYTLLALKLFNRKL